MLIRPSVSRIAASVRHPASLIFTCATSIILPVCDHALGVRGREPGAHQLAQQLSRKPVREHQRLGAAVARGGEQLKGAATVGLGAAAKTLPDWLKMKNSDIRIGTRKT